MPFSFKIQFLKPLQALTLRQSQVQQALGRRKSLRAETVLATLSAVGNDASHWSPIVITKKITVDESVPTSTLTFVGQEPKGRRVVLERN